MARRIVAVDISARSINRLKQRLLFSRIVRFYQKRAPITPICADMHTWKGGAFDYIIASNVLHHVPNPALLLKRLSGCLKPKGLLRLVTYPKASRIWMRQTGEWLGLQGVSPSSGRLVFRTTEVVRLLPKTHPIRGCFETHTEIGTATGIVDGWMHACENPLSPQEWQMAATNAGLVLAGEGQHETSQSGFLDEIVPELAKSSAWEKLQVLDDLLELTASPVLWLKKADRKWPRLWSSPVAVPKLKSALSVVDGQRIATGNVHVNVGTAITLPSVIGWEISQGLMRVAAVLAPLGLTLETVMGRLRDHVGPRVDAKGNPVPGLTAWEYPFPLHPLPKPWGMREWLAIEGTLGGGALYCEGQKAYGETLAEQAQWLQLLYGATAPWIYAELKEA